MVMMRMPMMFNPMPMMMKMMVTDRGGLMTNWPTDNPEELPMAYHSESACQLEEAIDRRDPIQPKASPSGSGVGGLVMVVSRLLVRHLHGPRARCRLRDWVALLSGAPHPYPQASSLQTCAFEIRKLRLCAEKPQACLPRSPPRASRCRGHHPSCRLCVIRGFKASYSSVRSMVLRICANRIMISGSEQRKLTSISSSSISVSRSSPQLNEPPPCRLFVLRKPDPLLAIRTTKHHTSVDDVSRHVDDSIREA
jgi:hypothetical protein